MGGFFGVASKSECTWDLFYGTDYHSHLGTYRGGLALHDGNDFLRAIHDISNSPFRTKFEVDIHRMKGNYGIGVISDTEDQPLIIGSHLGQYAIATVGSIKNIDALVKKAVRRRTTHFSEMSSKGINPTELVATLINEEETFEDGIRHAQESIDGSCSILLLVKNGIYAARDKYGRTPIALGKRNGCMAVTFETSAFPNLRYELIRQLGPGEIVFITPDGVEQKKSPLNSLRICAFLWVYYGYPSSSYEGINVELVRYRCGAALAQQDNVEVDCVAGIPDSGIAHAIGYANEKRLPYKRPFVKYTPTWPRSFMPPDQSIRDLIAKMKLIPIREIIENQRLLFCEDSIVRGTQLKDIILRLYHYGAKEVHMRPACPPLIFGCKFLNFSRSRSELELAARIAIREIAGRDDIDSTEFINPDSEKYCLMVEKIRQRLNLTTLRYQRLEELISAIGLPKEQVCTYCWDRQG